ncbi:MAG: c-type cytochrome [Deltaproteobacteria bacterium]|nr:c-type cytochrome [Deltaproteobacteria bacterium]
MNVLRVVNAVAIGLALAAVTQADDQAPVAKKASRETVTSGGWSFQLPLGLEAASAFIPENNPMTDEKIALGKLLYFDPRWSKDKSISCASCHNPYHGFTDPAPTSKGVGFKLGGRNSPTVINRLFSDKQFWDGRAADLEEQAHGPLINPVEMAMHSHDDVVTEVKKVKGYAPLFEKAFGSKEINMTRIAQAIAAYERTVVSGNSSFDRYMAGDKDAMSASAVRGMGLFNGKANCKTCHAAFNFTDESYHNLGVGADKPKPDQGRYEQTKVEADKGAFKTPTLRNVAETAPYMHDGSEATLKQVIELYNRGGVKNAYLSKEIKPLNLTAQEVDDLVQFMQALSGEVNNAEPPKELPR